MAWPALKTSTSTNATVNRLLRLACLTGALAALGACGFHPIYAPREGSVFVDKALNNVAIANIPDRQGQMLRNHLMDRMYFSGRPTKPQAELTVTLRSTETDLGVQKDATTARRQLNMWAQYRLKAIAGDELLKGSAHSSVSFSKMDAQYGTLAAEQNAYDRAIHEVGEQIVNRLSLYYAERPAQAPAAAPPAISAPDSIPAPDSKAPSSSLPN